MAARYDYFHLAESFDIFMCVRIIQRGLNKVLPTRILCQLPNQDDAISIYTLIWLAIPPACIVYASGIDGLERIGAQAEQAFPESLLAGRRNMLKSLLKLAKSP